MIIIFVMANHAAKVLTVALNPAIDRGIEITNFRIGAHQVGSQVFRLAAGKAVNVARVLDALHVPVSITGFVGRAQQGYFEKQLTGATLSCQLFPINGRTRENITIIDPVGKIDTHIRDRGFRVDGSDLTRLRKKLALVTGKDMIVCFSGSLPECVGVEDLVDLIQVCQMRRAKVCLDSGGSILRACSAMKLHIIKPNLSELSEMLGTPVAGEDDILRSCDRVSTLADIALISCGGAGGYILAGKRIWRGQLTIDPDLVKNTVGCGDAFLGGFLAATLTGQDIEEAFRYALAVATSAATAMVPAAVRLDQVERFHPLAEVTELTHPHGFHANDCTS